MRIARGAVKPAFGARINTAHPFARGHLLSILFNQPGLRAAYGAPFVHYGAAPPRVVSNISNNGGAMASNNEGLCYEWTTTVQYGMDLGADFLPTKNITILLIGHKTDTTL